jgi:hypothetical protein
MPSDYDKGLNTPWAPGPATPEVQAGRIAYDKQYGTNWSGTNPNASATRLGRSERGRLGGAPTWRVRPLRTE